MKKKRLLTLTFTAILAVQVAYSQTTETQDLMAKENLEKGMEFLAQNKSKEGVVELPSGLQYKIIKEGIGLKPDSPADTVTVHYTGTLIDGTVFDSSYNREKPSTFALNKVIKGWTEGFQHFREGTKAILYIPSDLAYGTRQRGEVISPNSVLVFEVELIHVSKAILEE
jgi:FKBP-type peptidyl-prolyl cis-trans isomerase